MTPSTFQQTIFDEIADGSGSLVIEAVAGSGKTTTIVEAARRLKPGGTYLAISFNKAIAESLQARMPYYVKSSTFHALCFDALKNWNKTQRGCAVEEKPVLGQLSKFTGIRVDANKTKWILKDMDGVTEDESWKLLPFVSRLVGYAKATTDLPENVDLEALIEYYDMDEPEDRRRAIAVVRKVLIASFSDRSRVDFDDMLWLTYHVGATFVPRADVLFIDEAQDLNQVQHALLSRILKPTSSEAAGDAASSSGRIIAVGDRHQSIYGFRGSRSDGLDVIRTTFNAKTLPLSVSYRCSQAVVAEAQRALGAVSKHSVLLRTPIDLDESIDPMDFINEQPF